MITLAANKAPVVIQCQILKLKKNKTMIAVMKSEPTIQRAPKDAANVSSHLKALIKLKRERQFANRNSHLRQGRLLEEVGLARAHLVSAKLLRD